jgi:hypothetical protein
VKLLLDLRIETVPSAYPSQYQRFSALAREAEIEFAPIRLPGLRLGGPVPDEYWAALRGASAFWISTPVLLAQPETFALVEKKLQEGAIAVCSVRIQGSMEVPGAAFFENLGIAPTPIGAFALEHNAKYDHPRLVQISRDQFPTAFRDTQLFRSVSSLVLQQPNGLGCSGYAQPAIALPADAIDVIDLRTDYRVFDFPKPELPVVAVSSRDSWAGRVIAMGADVFHDPYVGPLGDEFPGIGAEDNEQFARNLLRLIQSTPSVRGATWEDAYRTVRSIEYNIFWITKIVLSAAYGEKWFDAAVPEGVRNKCVERSAQERKGFPPSAYIDILDYEKVWRAQWTYVGPLLGDTSRNAGTKFFGRLNDIRKLTMHATKQISIDRAAPTAGELAELDQLSGHVIRLLDAAKRRPPQQ